MAEDVLKSPTTGKTLIPVATKTTTPTSDSKPKQVPVNRVYVEVIVSDSRFISDGSQWGHVAIVIDDIVYSRAHNNYVTTTKNAYLHGGPVQRADGPHPARGNGWRDNVGLVLWMSPRERDIVKEELERRVAKDREFRRSHPHDTTYSVFSNSCASNVADVLELVGILAHDPRWLPFPVTPAELLSVLEKSNRLVKKNYYPKKQ